MANIITVSVANKGYTEFFLNGSFIPRVVMIATPYIEKYHGLPLEDLERECNRIMHEDAPIDVLIKQKDESFKHTLNMLVTNAYIEFVIGFHRMVIHRSVKDIKSEIRLV